jgi:hypothetical protein
MVSIAGESPVKSAIPLFLLTLGLTPEWPEDRRLALLGRRGCSGEVKSCLVWLLGSKIDAVLDNIVFLLY